MGGGSGHARQGVGLLKEPYPSPGWLTITSKAAPQSPGNMLKVKGTGNQFSDSGESMQSQRLSTRNISSCF